MQLTYLEAIRQGIWEEMEKDPTVFCLGEDIGIYGGAFKVTDGFIDRFGPERVIDTPIAESAIVGAAFGASLTGMRPVAEFQFMDFIACAVFTIGIGQLKPFRSKVFVTVVSIWGSLLACAHAAFSGIRPCGTVSQ